MVWDLFFKQPFLCLSLSVSKLHQLSSECYYFPHVQQNNVLVRFALDDVPTLLDQIFLQLRSQLKCVAYEKTLSGVERAGVWISHNP